MRGYFVIFGALVLAGCGGPKPSPKPSPHSTPPAKVTQISDELELASVQLTAEAEKRLGVSVVAVKREPMSVRRPYPGLVVVPPENVTLLLAPVTGVASYLGPEPMAVGTKVEKGESLFSFAPLLVENYALGPTQRDSLRASRLAVEQSEAAILTRINNAKVEVDASAIDLGRAEQLFKEKVGSRKRVDDAKGRFQLAKEVLDSAQRELAVLRRVNSESQQPIGQAPRPMLLAAPMTGVISKVQVGSGQTVTAGQPLLELLNLKRLWLRVRIPQIEASAVRSGEMATLMASGRQVMARPISGPATGDPLAATVDLYYELDNSSMSPDQRVEVSLPLSGSGQQLVVPTAAVLTDVYGGSWVYVRSKVLTYRRVRVQVDYSSDKGQAVLRSGPEPGAEVVVNGAAEIYGIEFGND
jgi:membrane fusion protein, heavy metal efflux system